ncbi:MAG: hypothetical protein WCJ30_14845, partial [Deltaproteobacteria bacterium]
MISDKRTIREFAGEFLGGMGAPRTEDARLRLGAKIRLGVIAPFILLPMWHTLHTRTASAWSPRDAGLLVHSWEILLGVYLVGNLAMLLPSISGRALYALTVLIVFLELGTNQLSMWNVGSITSTGVLYVVLIVAVYRVFFDYRLGLVATVVGCGFYALSVWIEWHGLLARAPLLPARFVHPLDHDGSGVRIIVDQVVSGTFLAFFAVNYGVNQSVKLHRYLTESVLRRYLPPSLVARAARGELRLDAAPERRVVTVMFTDLVGFTSLSERLGAEAV